ncbi:MAG: NAD(P)-binding protein, partial [Planctomycetota bacterium]
MAVRITNLRMPVEQPETELSGRIARRLKLPEQEIQRWRILRKSLDARSRSDLKFVYSVIVDVRDEPACLKRLAMDRDIAIYQPESFDDPQPGQHSISSRPVIVGSGPAGLLAGYYLARRGYRPLIIERGQAVKERVPVLRAFDRHEADHQNENNYL